jgi:hypothetical protein
MRIARRQFLRLAPGAAVLPVLAVPFSALSQQWQTPTVMETKAGTIFCLSGLEWHLTCVERMPLEGGG